MTKTLVAVSGGLDSSYVLWKLLSATDDEVSPIYFDQSYVVNAQRSYQPDLSVIQTRKVKSILGWVSSNVRSLQPLRTHVVNSPVANDSSSTYYIRVVAQYINDGSYDRVAFGWGARRQNGAGITTPDTNSGKTHQIYKDLMQTLTGNSSNLWFPITEWNANTFKIVSELPSELFNISYSCIKPVIADDGNINECGECWKCHWKYLVKYKVDEGSLTAETFPSWIASQPDSVSYMKNGVSKSFDKTVWTATFGNERKNYASKGSIWEGAWSA